MKKMNLVIVVSLLLVGFWGCAAGPIATQNDPFADLQKQATKIMNDGGVAVVGDAIGQDHSVAKDKAIMSAQGRMAESFEVKVDRLKKRFFEEIGDNNPEINQSYTDVMKTVASVTLIGAIPVDTRYYNEPKTKKPHYGVLLAINPKVINESILNEMSKKPKLYERFRASQAFEDLQKEIDNYKKEKDSGNVNY